MMAPRATFGICDPDVASKAGSTKGTVEFIGRKLRERENLKGTAGRLARWIPKDSEGYFRNWKEIEAWTDGIAMALRPAPTV